MKRVTFDSQPTLTCYRLEEGVDIVAVNSEWTIESRRLEANRGDPSYLFATKYNLRIL